jgi:hypothetical protein
LAGTADAAVRASAEHGRQGIDVGAFAGGAQLDVNTLAAAAEAIAEAKAAAMMPKAPKPLAITCWTNPRPSAAMISRKRIFQRCPLVSVRLRPRLARTPVPSATFAGIATHQATASMMPGTMNSRKPRKIATALTMVMPMTGSTTARPVARQSAKPGRRPPRSSIVARTSVACSK